VIARPFLILRGGPEKMQASWERGAYRPRPCSSNAAR
jgi:hypothetical protein